IVVMSPWILFNLARFHDPTFVSTNDGITLAGANCDDTYYGKGIGLWQIGSCTGRFPSGDESQTSTTYRHRAFDYTGDHVGRVPISRARRPSAETLPLTEEPAPVGGGGAAR